jgi:hypothetical protein
MSRPHVAAQRRTIPSSKRSPIKKQRQRVVEDDADAFHPARLYRTKRLAQLLDVDESTVWKMRQRGDLPPFTQVGNIRGLTGPQLKDVLKRREAE